MQNDQRNCLNGSQKRQKNTPKLPKMRKTHLPQTKEILLKLRLWQDKQSPLIQLAKEESPQKKQDLIF
jgi:hypothetical protein